MLIGEIRSRPYVEQVGVLIVNAPIGIFVDRGHVTVTGNGFSGLKGVDVSRGFE